MEENNNSVNFIKPKNKTKARISRVFAVKALYGANLDKDLSKSKTELLEYYLNDYAKEFKEGKPDPQYLARIFYNAIDNKEQIDEIIAANLSDNWKIERLDKLLRAILEAGISEMLDGNFDANLIISEYVKITDGFYDQKECNFVNRLLDTVAHKLKLKSKPNQEENKEDKKQ